MDLGIPNYLSRLWLSQLGQGCKFLIFTIPSHLGGSIIKLSLIVNNGENTG
jgi:hypothetical protein